MLVCWCVGVLVCWCVGVLVCGLLSDVEGLRAVSKGFTGDSLCGLARLSATALCILELETAASAQTSEP